MSQIFTRLLLIALLFGSIEAAVDAVHINSNHNQGTGHLIHDLDESNSDFDDQKDSCNHHCHCTSQLGLIFTYCFNSYQTFIIDKILNFYPYCSQLIPPLFRPPII